MGRIKSPRKSGCGLGEEGCAALTLGLGVLEGDPGGCASIGNDVSGGQRGLEQLSELGRLEVLHAAVGVVDDKPLLGTGKGEGGEEQRL